MSTYGFVGGDASQWQPNLFRNTTPIFPFQGNPAWNLTTAMADEAMQYMRQSKALAPEKPFFVYYVPGGTHAPHHPTKEWIDKISAMHLFDDGWEKLRETIFANQRRLGIMPANAQLTPWPDGQEIYGGAKLPRWDSLDWSKRSSSSSKRRSMRRTRPTRITRSAVSSRPSKTSDFSTTR